ncbi:MAG: hypothetical protein ACR2RL_09515 [Gammaproteobacteria bacterium]
MIHRPHRLSASLSALILVSVSIAAKAGSDCDAKSHKHAGSIGPVALAMAARESTECRNANGAEGWSELSQFSMSLAGGSFGAQYRWSRAANGSTERHGVTITPLDGKHVAVRIHGQRVLNFKSGTHGTAFKIENGFQIGALRSTASLSREAKAEERTTSAEFSLERDLFRGQLSMRAEHGEWHVQKSAQESHRRSRSAFAVEVARRGVMFGAGYAHKREDLAMNRNVYTAHATLPVFKRASQRQSVSFRAEISDPVKGRTTQAISVSTRRSHRYSNQSVELRYGQSQSGQRHVKLSVATHRKGAMSLESSIELKRGGGQNDAAIHVAANYRF